METSRQLAAGPSVAPSRVSLGGGLSNSSMASGIFFQSDGQSLATASSISGTVRSGLGNVSAEMNHGPLNSTANSSAPSIGASSLVTDANSALSGGPQLQRSSSINNESYMRLPASPMSFTSNSISGSSVMDGSSIVQQCPHHDSSSHIIKQEPVASSVHAQKKPRLEMRQDDVLQQQVIHQLLQRQETMQMQAHQNPQLNAIIQQQRIAQQRQQLQQQQILQSLPHMQRGLLMSQYLRPSQMQIQAVPPFIRRVTDGGICARRLMQYMYHQRHRPPDNSILYWRKFVAEYFAQRAKKRWCLSMYENVGSQALGAFPQAAMDAWQCDICGSKFGKGFEATYEVLPRLSQIKFDCGIIDELLFLDYPRECKLSSGLMVLEYAKAIQESVYEQLRVVREGHLRITFTQELKILSWEFCARRHEEFFSRRAIAPQVNQLLQAAHKYQSAVNESGTTGVPLQDLQASCNMFMTAGRQLVRNLELHSLNDLGFSKRYVRCLQISEVVNSMKDLIDFSRENKIGPIESLKCYPQQAAAKLQAQKMQEVHQMTSSESLQPDQSSHNKIMAMHTGLSFSNQTINNQTAARFSNTTPQNTAASNNYQYLLRTLSTPNNDPSQPQQSAPFITKAPSFNSGSSAPNQQSSNVSFLQGNQQNLEQHVIQQLFQEMMKNNKPNQEQIKNDVMVPSGSRSNSLKFVAANNNNSSSSSSSFSEKPDLLQNLHLPELDQDILHEFAESGIQW